MTKCCHMVPRILAWNLLLLVTCQIAAGQTEEGYVELFNGQDLNGWKGNPKLWSVEDGAIVGRTTSEDPIEFNTFLIWNEGTVADFELQLDYRIEDGNSGIQYRSKVLDDEQFIVGGYQADIDTTLRYTGINYEERGRGILAERGQRVTIDASGNKHVEQFGDPAELAKHIHSDGWNHYRIVAQGNRLRHFVNDVLMSEVIDQQAPHASQEGVLALQLHRGPAMVIRFKNIRLKKLAAE
ncbi:MAG: hypothetical protein KatS3mg111_2492 [Pirellulaceae bacterium]|nr:MAG: hypothetical protein KatS3mg111_2492 [Pirellulaceae bacterium]